MGSRANRRSRLRNLIALLVISFALCAVYVGIFHREWIGAATNSLSVRFPVAAPASLSIAGLCFSVWKLTHLLRTPDWDERIVAGLWAGIAFIGAVYFANQALTGGVGA